MPMAAPGAQVMRKKPSYNEEETLALAAYVATFGPGPAIPSEEQINEWQNASVSEGGELFRTNCAQCHNFAGSGGALTNGKYAPSLGQATPLQIYEPIEIKARAKNKTRTEANLFLLNFAKFANLIYPYFTK